MTIEALTANDKVSIALWHYEDEHVTFNYALRKGGWIDCYCNADDSLSYVARENGSLIGLFFFIASKSNEFRILINPDFLNKGYGKELMKKALETAFGELNFTEVSLIVRKNHAIAIALYEKIGFMTTGETVETIENQETELLIMTKSNQTQKGK